MIPTGASTWILTGSHENFAVTREQGFRVIGIKERRRRLAESIEPGDQIVFYVTGLQAFGAIARIAGSMYEDRSPVWPGKAGKAEAYPWRFEAAPLLVLAEDDFVPAVELVGELEHARKWPVEHWSLAFQGQLRTVSATDADLLWARMHAAAGERATAPSPGVRSAGATVRPPLHELRVPARPGTSGVR